jgi:hypothetical protein
MVAIRRIAMLGLPPAVLYAIAGFAMPPAWLQAAMVPRDGIEPPTP